MLKFLHLLKKIYIYTMFLVFFLNILSMFNLFFFDFIYCMSSEEDVNNLDTKSINYIDYKLFHVGPSDKPKVLLLENY
jgi:hypothetical protein